MGADWIWKKQSKQVNTETHTCIQGKYREKQSISDNNKVNKHCEINYVLRENAHMQLCHLPQLGHTWIWAGFGGGLVLSYFINYDTILYKYLW